MLRSKNSLLALICTLTSILFVQGCGDDSDRKKGPVTDFSNFTDLRLATLTVDAGELEPAFDPDYLGPYSLNLGPDVESINIAAAPQSEQNRLLISKSAVGADADPESNEIEAGEVDTKTIHEGDNLISLRLGQAGVGQVLTYTLNVHRVNSRAMLTDIDVYERLVIEGRLVDAQYTLDPEFDSVNTGVVASTNVPYVRCSTNLRGFTNDRYTRYSINGGDDLQHTDSVLIELPLVGENAFELVAEAGVGVATETYNLIINRAAGTSEEVAANATLRSIHVTDADITSPFNCYSLSMAANVNRDVSSVQISAVPSEPGVTLRFGVPVIEGNIVTGLADGAVEMLPDTPLDVVLDESVESRSVEVTSADGEVTLYYRVTLTHLNTNIVAVDSAEELQAALRNAEPGDEIVLAEGEYQGVASVEASGDETAHFFSDRSGVSGDPIIVRSASTSSASSLSGMVLTDNTVLKVSGDYWQINNVHIGGAQNGVLLDAASNNIIENIVVENVGERGMIIANGSSNNQVYGSRFVSTGVSPREGQENLGEAIVIGSSAESWASAPAGSLDEKDYDNAIRSNQFGPNLGAEAIELSEGTLRTHIQYNRFETRGMGAAEDGSLIVVKGNDSTVSYNHFYDDGSTGLTTLLSTKNVSADWVGDNWGEDNHFFQNIAELGGADIALASSGDVAQLNVTENSREDGVDIRYSGVGINDAFMAPMYQIQTSTDAPLCLREQRPYPTLEELEADPTALSSFPVVYMAECASTADQQWKLMNAGEGYVFISPADAVHRVLLPPNPAYAANFIQSLSSSSPFFPVAVTLDPAEDIPRILNLWDGYYLRWAMLHNGEDVVFSNRSQSNFVLTAGDTDGDPAAVFPAGFGDYKFRLVEQ